MKKKSIIIWSVITLLTVMAVLEIFSLHPHISVGRHGVVWTSLRNIGHFGSRNLTADGTKYDVLWLGPVMILTSV
jgi:hypothetical protein